MSVTEAKKIPKSVLNRNQAWKDLQRNPICLIEFDCDYILDKIKLRDTIEYEVATSVGDNEEYFI